MAEITNELIYEVLKQIQTAQGDLRGEVSYINRRLGSLAENFNHMRHEIQTIRDDMRKLRSDVEIIAMAVDDHSDRIGVLEENTPPTHT